MSKKLSVSEFISDKQLSKIEKIIEKSPNTDDAYDKIENLLIDNFTVKDLGTNRLILINNKHDKYICKIAGDSHGIEANYREFYNGDLDEKRITKSYSISENGVFLVQEKVKPFTSDMMKKYKKDVRKMLSHLEDKLLLVDCKLSNFKNFGMRKNGDIVLLDHGDTIPLTMYENGHIVNIVEESNVSLRCKEFKKGTLTSKNPKQCGGKLKYSKNYDYFICEKCGAKVNIHDAYKEFYGDARKPIDSSALNTFQKGFDPEEYEKQVQNSIRQYAKDTMNNIKNKKENENMKKHINGQICQQIKGYWLPINSNKKFASAKLMAVKRGEITPYDYLVFLNLNPNDYKMNYDDHKISREEKINNDDHINKLSLDILDYLFKLIKSHSSKSRRFENEIDSRRNGIFYIININEIENAYDVRKNIYYIQKSLKFNENVDYVFFDKENIYIKLNKDVVNDINENADEIKLDDYEVELNDEEDDDIELDDEDEDKEDEKDIKYILSFSDITKLETANHMDTECFILDGYYIPLEIINKYYDGNNFNLPEISSVLDDNGYNPDFYKIEHKENVDDSISYYDINNEDEIVNCDECEISDDDYHDGILNALSKGLLKILNESGYNERGYGIISYEDMYNLFKYYLIDNNKYIEDGSIKLTDYAISKIREFDYVEDITDYCAAKSYEIEVKGKRLVNDVTDIIIDESNSFIESVNKNPSISNDNAISLLIKLIDLSNNYYDDVICGMSIIHLLTLNYDNYQYKEKMEYIKELLINIRTIYVNPISTYISHYIEMNDIDNDVKIHKIKSIISLECNEISNYLFSQIFNREIIFEIVEKIMNLVPEDYEYKNFIDYFSKNMDNLKRRYITIYDNSIDTSKNLTENNNDINKNISNIIKISLSSVNEIELDLDDIKDKEFKIHCVKDDESSVILKINLYNIIKNKIS